MATVQLKKNKEQKAEERENKRGDTRKSHRTEKVRGVMSCRDSSTLVQLYRRVKPGTIGA